MKRRWIALFFAAALLLSLCGCGTTEAALVGEWRLDYIIDNESGEKMYADTYDIVLSFDRDGSGYYKIILDSDPNFSSTNFKWSVENGNQIIARYVIELMDYELPQVDSWNIHKLSGKNLSLRDFLSVAKEYCFTKD